ncbi:hypothetical protein JTE88_05095 [Arcanobacterium phocisimile]|uniref:Uncharacterized protein n=1 Tax=Arcanobacterium phocisimile TaxID=1302235 RepID=A0ABX7IEQ4_9ACTO|nr:hypothetical protein [Arcanobacterium phocisimile]QRV01492.1 hypothetical protein JTE88_05095 [Arcanobacterium phocisimile]
MSITAGSLNYLLPIIERFTRLPGKILVAVAGSITALSLTVGWFAGRSSATWIGWWPFAVSVFFAYAVIIFAVLRFRLQRAVDATIEKLTGTIADSTAVTIIDEDGNLIGNSEYSFDDEIQRVRNAQRRSDAQKEAADKRNVFFPRVEAAQRAAIAGAGGVENAPYLRDDLRITIVTALLSVASIPTGIFTLLVGLIIWI